MAEGQQQAEFAALPRQRLRIALHVDGRRVRGNERQLLYLAADLVHRGHSVHVACVGGTPVAAAFGAAGAEVASARPRGDVDPVSLARYVHWLRKVRPDAVLLSSWKRAAVSALGARLARVPRVVLRVGGPHEWRGRFGDRARRHALRRWIDVLWTNSEALGAQLRAYACGEPRGGVRVIPNAVELPPVEPFALRAALGIPADATIVISVSGLERNKGHDVLLAAIAALPDDVHLVIAGDGPERNALERQAATLGVSRRVYCLGHRDDVPALLAAADVFALATRADSTPNAALEAMAAGIPVVITAVPGSAALLGAAGSAPRGWVAPVDDAAALARAIEEALGAEGAARARRAREHVAREHSRRAVLERVEALLGGG